MGLIESTIALQNQMTPVLDSIINSMHSVISVAENLSDSTDDMLNTFDIRDARSDLKDAEFQIKIINSELSKQAIIAEKAVGPLKEMPEPIKQSKDAQNDLNTSFSRGDIYASKMGSTIKRVVGLIAGAVSAKALGGLSDELASANARLNGLVDSQEELLKVQEMIFNSAQKTGSEYFEQINIVAKLGGQAKEAFNGLDEVIKFQESVNMIFYSSGTSTIEAKNASLQLTQALASGVLRGDELNSIFEQAPDLIRYVANYMDVPIGQIRKMAAEGEITGDIVKNAIFSAYGDIEKRFNDMPKTWRRIWIEMKNDAIKSLEPALLKLNEFANSEAFNVFKENASEAIGRIANGLGWLIEQIVLGSNVIADNWDVVEPILLGIAGAMGVWTLATTVQAAAQAGLNAALLANPIFIFAAAVGIIIMALAHWVRSVGGVEMAHLIARDKILTTYENVQVGLLRLKNNWKNSNAKMAVSSKIFVNNVLNTIGFLKTQGLGIVDSFLNGIIERINQAIDLVNMIPGIEIEAVEHVTLKAESAAKEEKLKKEREAELNDIIKNYEQAVEENNAELSALEAENKSNQIARARDMMDLRERQINELYQAKKSTEAINAEPDFLSSVPDFTAIKNATKGTENNTKSLKDGIEVKNEDISYLRDLMERRAIQNFSFDKLEVVANNSFGDVHETADLNGWMEGLTDQLRETVSTTMGGVSAYDY